MTFDIFPHIYALFCKILLEQTHFFQPKGLKGPKGTLCLNNVKKCTFGEGWLPLARLHSFKVGNVAKTISASVNAISSVPPNTKTSAEDEIYKIVSVGAFANERVEL